MSGRKNSTVTILLVVAVSLITTTLTVLFMSKYHEDIQFQMIGGICQMLTEADAVDTDALLKAVKGNRDRVQVSSAKTFWRVTDISPQILQTTDGSLYI